MRRVVKLQGQLNFEYLPLRAGDQQAKLELFCAELGTFQYELQLHASAPAPLPSLHMKASLGTSDVRLAKFINFSRQKVDYVSKVDNPQFHVDKMVSAAPGWPQGTEVSLEVTYEPNTLGEARGILSVSSPYAGEYFIPLFGTCTAPKPQGPFLVKAGQTTSLPFRNVFPSTTTFICQLDHPAFHVAKATETVRAHKECKILVGFDGTDHLADQWPGGGASAPSAQAALPPQPTAPTGQLTGAGQGTERTDKPAPSIVLAKLTVSCPRSAGTGQAIQWVYYLRGVA